MLQNVRVTTFTISELLRKNQQGVKLQSPFQHRLKYVTLFLTLCMKELKSQQSSLLNLKRKYSVTLNKKCFPLNISSVNVTKSAENYGFGHNY